MKCGQKSIRLSAKRRGCHLVSSEIMEGAGSLLNGVQVGMCNIFLQHTSASLTINENCCPDVRVDMETFLNRTVPEGRTNVPWTHTDEGPDDMPGHVKSSMFGVSLNVPVTNGKLNLGTWQGIWLCEHRDHASSRSVVVTVMGS
ncbi:secondary thiamine-phosphate synthase [Chloropicon primus]|uniref:Secondary thiamine-phosphate synthase n=1 Tax=Chloropicon primus TaxID=1764295 RepID=A0A5B8MW39_9CHLO|nr:secondary thiamine-phosphate synthase [Chloropicon primus]UPR03969.1 secondary thiamine-phosphate synthase [Chloropicon primus]|eukprot:QDZ24763.1 secondary thiamine-phosphate synthase [Chloropicon primus]